MCCCLSQGNGPWLGSQNPNDITCKKVKNTMVLLLIACIDTKHKNDETLYCHCILLLAVRSTARSDAENVLQKL